MLALLAATPVIAEPVAEVTASATNLVKRALGLSKQADKRSKKAIRIARRALNRPIPAGPTGPTGPTGPAGSSPIMPAPGPEGSSSIEPADFGVIPAVSAFATEAQSVKHEGSGASVLLDSEYFDTAEMHSTVEDQEKLFAPVDGIYQVNAALSWASDPDGLRQLFLRKNGVGSSLATDARAPAGSPYTTGQSVSALVPLEKGDYIDARVFQSSGGGELNIQPTGITPVVSMVWVAPL